MELVIQILKEDIQKGQRCTSYKCPLACAVRRICLLSKFVTVHVNEFVVFLEKEKITFCIPNEVQEIIALYDATGEMKEFTFRAVVLKLESLVQDFFNA